MCINLAELIDLAQSMNSDTRIAWEQAKQAAFAVGLSLADYLPQISADALFGYQHTAIPLPKFVNPTGEIIIDTAQVFPAFVIKWLLFDFGKRDCMLEAALARSYASNVAFTEAHQKLIFEVAKAYFDFNAARTQLRVCGRSFEKHRNSSRRCRIQASKRIGKNNRSGYCSQRNSKSAL